MFCWVGYQNKRPTARMSLLCLLLVSELFKNFADSAGADGTSTFSDGELGAFFNGDRVDQFNVQGNVIARHNHFRSGRERDDARNIGRAEVELRTVVAQERSVTATFFFGEDVDTGDELGVRGDRTRFAENLTADDLVTVDAS